MPTDQLLPPFRKPLGVITLRPLWTGTIWKESMRRSRSHFISKLLSRGKACVMETVCPQMSIVSNLLEWTHPSCKIVSESNGLPYGRVQQIPGTRSPQSLEMLSWCLGPVRITALIVPLGGSGRRQSSARIGNSMTLFPEHLTK